MVVVTVVVVVVVVGILNFWGCKRLLGSLVSGLYVYSE